MVGMPLLLTRVLAQNPPVYITRQTTIVVREKQTTAECVALCVHMAHAIQMVFWCGAVALPRAPLFDAHVRAGYNHCDAPRVICPGARIEIRAGIRVMMARCDALRAHYARIHSNVAFV